LLYAVGLEREREHAKIQKTNNGENEAAQILAYAKQTFVLKKKTWDDVEAACLWLAREPEKRGAVQAAPNIVASARRCVLSYSDADFWFWTETFR
jgi:hypothetical protein